MYAYLPNMRRAGLRHSPHPLAAGRVLFQKTTGLELASQSVYVGAPGEKESGGIRMGHQTDNIRRTIMIMVKPISSPLLTVASLRMYGILKRPFVRFR